MKVRKVIDYPIRSEGKNINIAGGITGVVSANVNESGTSSVESHQKVSVVQSRKRKVKPEKDS
jgi:hypothetical protein